jgi:threonyl-tRNA synthetase
MLSEIRGFMELAERVYKTLGMPNYKVFVATRPEKRMGSDDIWDKAEGALTDALKALGIPYALSPGEGAFYGPKVEIHFVDAINRTWQLGTIQIDFNMPEAFNLVYVGDDNAEHRPVMLHRAILGSLERFIGVYVEHVAGRLPAWLAPEQVRVINVGERQLEYGGQVEAQLRAAGIRATFDRRNEKLGYKIREAQLQKVPYMAVVGDNEVATQTLSLRLRSGETTSGATVAQFVEAVRDEIRERRLASPFTAASAGEGAGVDSKLNGPNVSGRNLNPEAGN